MEKSYKEDNPAAEKKVTYDKPERKTKKKRKKEEVFAKGPRGKKRI